MPDGRHDARRARCMPCSLGCSAAQREDTDSRGGLAGSRRAVPGRRRSVQLQHGAKHAGARNGCCARGSTRPSVGSQHSRPHSGPRPTSWRATSTSLASVWPRPGTRCLSYRCRHLRGGALTQGADAKGAEKRAREERVARETKEAAHGRTPGGLLQSPLNCDVSAPPPIAFESPHCRFPLGLIDGWLPAQPAPENLPRCLDGHKFSP